MKSACVYCGSNTGSKQIYAERAIALGAELARRNIRLVYGGGNVDLMGIVANAVLASGGEVTGVIPQQLVNLEGAHRDVTQLEIVGSMHERKARMFALSDGFIDVDGFFTPLIAMMDRMVEERFLHAEQRADLWHGNDIAAMLTWMKQYEPLQATPHTPAPGTPAPSAARLHYPQRRPVQQTLRKRSAR